MATIAHLRVEAEVGLSNWNRGIGSIARDLGRTYQNAREIADRFRQRPIIDLNPERVQQQVAAMRRYLRQIGTEAARVQGEVRNLMAGIGRSLSTVSSALFSVQTLMGVLAGSALFRELGRAFQAADEATRATRQLSATARLAGIDLAFLTDAAAGVRDGLQLAEPVANAVTGAMGRLASRAGDVARTGEAVRRFMDLLAANGLAAAEGIDILRQTLAGADEGLNRLGLDNPSQIYARWGAGADQASQAQAILNEIMHAGAQVQGEYARSLTEITGRQDRANQAMMQARAALGDALGPARLAAVEAMARAFADLAETIRENQSEVREFASDSVELVRSLGQLATALSKPFRITFDGLDKLREWNDLLGGDRIRRAMAQSNPAGFSAAELERLGLGPQAIIGDVQRIPAVRLRREVENRVLIGLDRATLDAVQMADRMAEIARADPIARPAAPTVDPDEFLMPFREQAATLGSLYDSLRARGADVSAVVSEMYRLHGRLEQVIRAEGDGLTRMRVGALQMAAELQGMLNPSLTLDTDDFRAELETAAAEAKRILDRSTVVDLTVRVGAVQQGAEDARRYRQLESAARAAQSAGSDDRAGVLGAWLADFGQGLLSLLNPMTAAASIFRGALESVGARMQALTAPLAAVASVLAEAILPVMRALFPVFQAMGYVAALASEGIARMVGFFLDLIAGLREAFGRFVLTLGRLIDSLPFVSGKGIIRYGEHLLEGADRISDAAAGARGVAEEMEEAQRRIREMTWENTIAGVDELGEAAQKAAQSMANVPELFDLALRRRQAAIAGIRVETVRPTDRGGSLPAQPLEVGGPSPSSSITVHVHNPPPGVDGERVGQDVRRVIRDDPQVKAYIQSHARAATARRV